MKRLQFARNLAKKNNMEYKQTYKKYSDSKVLPNKFSEGMLCWLHQPELLKINPKICSPFFGPWVILTLVGKMNAVIQYLANKKTRFVNINRLRHYNLQTNHFNKNQPNNIVPLQSQGKPFSDNDNQLETKDSTVQYHEFDNTGYVNILNPSEPAPQPIQIKVEGEATQPSIQLPSDSGGGAAQHTQVLRVIHFVYL